MEQVKDSVTLKRFTIGTLVAVMIKLRRCKGNKVDNSKTVTISKPLEHYFQKLGIKTDRVKIMVFIRQHSNNSEDLIIVCICIQIKFIKNTKIDSQLILNYYCFG